MKVFFSVIIPTYNQGNLLSKCIKSVLNQTYKNYEIIIIDNNSTDNTRSIIKKYKKKIVYKKIKNYGVIAKSRNLGIKIAKGNWISFLDSDDSWTRDKLEKTYYAIKNNKFDVVCNSEWIISKNKTKVWAYGPSQNNLYLKMLKYGNILSTSASSVKKKFLKKEKIMFNQNKKFVTSEDYDFFLNIAQSGGKFYFILKPLGYHLFHSKSSSFKINRHKRSINEVLKYHIFDAQNKIIDKKNFFIICNSNLKFKYKLAEFLNKKNKLKRILPLLKKIYNNPINFVKFSFILVYRKLRNTFVYFIN